MKIFNVCLFLLLRICDGFKITSMDFNLKKDSLWLSYPLKKTYLNNIDKKIPITHKIAKCKIFEDDIYDYRLFFNVFEVQTPFFNGNRLEVVTLAKNINTNDVSFIILDCFTNVMSWDPIDGIQKANSNFKKLITNSKYNILIEEISKNNNHDNKDNKDNKDKKKKNNYIFNLTSFKGKIKKTVLPSFSIDPNYVCYFKNYPKGYKLAFNIKQIDQKVKILKDIKLKHDIYSSYIKDLEHAFIYPQKMNFKVFLE